MWCFNCKLDQNGEFLALCKDLGHDIDYEHMFQTTNYETNQTHEKKGNLSTSK